MELADILAKRSVLICTDLTSKRQLFEQLADNAAETTGHDRSEILTTLLERETLGSTGLGDGVAVPHGKLAGLDGVTAVFARLSPALEFDSVDDLPVDLVMMLLAPAGSGADHLKALSRVARLLRTEALVADLRKSHDPQHLYEILTSPVATYVAA
ncbi:PTS sugar transporter subunit IIA [Devosia rhodophyticola]|uniref:PTS sugar transporter subunit IIA n=1 Tax=Devosia rhodophyticola TaxID=3026423 RepID=A0ABY7Z0L1_9HYPH|nr:PTS sugar transporter subunit IIA [Devosia rhodophyticola]WDR07136.1 PTS sugar transporter subunit IIA [Devosia rhodophyticola]